jgi:NADPH-dependent curcumin reductase CurA
MLPSCGETRFGGADHPRVLKAGPAFLACSAWEGCAQVDGKAVFRDQECEVEAASSTTAGGAPTNERFEINRLSSVHTMPRRKETVVVSAASGAVGSVVGQIAKIKGCRAVGIAGSVAKCRYAVDELGFDACINRRAPNFVESLARACPSGVDIYF